MEGEQGPKGEKGERGAAGKDGKDGRDGTDGKEVSLEQVKSVAEIVIQNDPRLDPFLIGSKKLSEAGMKDGMVIQYDAKGDRLGYATIKQVASQVSKLSGRGLSLPSQSGNSGKFLTTDGTRSSWATAGAGSGDVVGPASATDSNFAAFDTTTGKLLKDSGLNSASFAAALGADDNYVTDAEKVVIGNTSGTNTGDQLTFKTVAVSGQSNVVADTATDTLTLIAGSNIEITTDATNDTITITGTGSGGTGITRVVASVSTNTAAGATAATDYVYLCSSTMTLTMPTAVGNTNRYSVKNKGVNTVTVALDGAETGDGSATLSLLPNVAVDLISDNSNFFIL